MDELMVSSRFASDHECLVCYETLNKVIMMLICEPKDENDIENCVHSFCGDCVEDIKKQGLCPVCRRKVLSTKKNLIAMKFMEERLSVNSRLRELEEKKKTEQINSVEIERRKKENEEKEETIRKMQEKMEQMEREKKEQEGKIQSLNKEVEKAKAESKKKNSNSAQELKKLESELDKISKEKRKLESLQKEKDEQLEQIQIQRLRELEEHKKQVQSQIEQESHFRAQLRDKEIEQEFLERSSYNPAASSIESSQPLSFLPTTSSSSSGIFGAFSTLSCQLWGYYGPLLSKITEYDIRERRGSKRTTPVWKALEKSKNGIVALKSVVPTDRSQITLSSFREAMMLSKMSHPNIIKLDGVVWDPVSNDLYMKFSFTEFDLDYMIRSCPEKLNVGSIMTQLLSAVFYLHSGEIAHCDIKPTSIVYSDKDRIKLTSFGTARSKYSELSELPLRMIHYGWAPELMWRTNQSISPLDYKAVDMWAVGCIFGQLLLRSSSPLFSHNFERPIKSRLLKQSSSVSAPSSVSTSSATKSRIRLRHHSALLKNILRIRECAPRNNLDLYSDILRFNYSQVIMSDGKTTLSLQEDIIPKMDDYEGSLLKSMLEFDAARRNNARDALHHEYFRRRNLVKQDHLLICALGSQMGDSCIPEFLKDKCGFPV